MDARTGAPVILDRGSGVDLVYAVAASCSSGLPFAVGDRLLINGGYRRNENADLAAGCERVLVLSPFGARSRHPASWGTDLATQVRELETAGSRFLVLTPDDPADRMQGAGAVDVSRRAEAAQAGYAVARAYSQAVQELWG